MPRIIGLNEAAALFGVGPKRLRQIHAETPIPGGFKKNERGDLAFYDSTAFRFRAAQKKGRKELSRARQAWKSGARPIPPEIPQELKNASIDAMFSDLPGVRATGTDLDLSGVPESAKPAVMNAIGKRLQFIARNNDWWRGDAMLLAEKLGKRISFDEMKEHGLKMKVAAFYSHSVRRDELTFQHHAEAMIGTHGNLAIALSRLDLARQKNLSASRLRAHIRQLAGDSASDG